MTEKRIKWLQEQLKDAEFVHLGNWKDGAQWDVQGDLEELIEERTVAAEARKEVIEMAKNLAYEVMGGSLNLASSYVERLYQGAERLINPK